MLNRKSSIFETNAAFGWDVPELYNMGVDVCDRLAQMRPDDIAVIDVRAEGTQQVSYAELSARSNQLAQALSRLCQRGDRVGVLLPQCTETLLSHIAAFKMGAISLPLFTLFGPDALLHRLRDSGARVVITDAGGVPNLAKIRGCLPDLAHVIVVDAADGDELSFEALCSAESPDFTPVNTHADDPALLIYTSGTTGAPKGALHGHRVLRGHLPGVEMSHDFLPQPGDRLWTPADWAWIGGLLDVALPALHHGVPLVAHRFRKFTGAAAFDFLETHGIRNAFLPPTALKLMRQEEGRSVAMRSVASGGETLGAELLDWGRAAFGVTINEFYGQTECNMVVSSCAALAPPEPGVMGWPVPGHRVAILNATGEILPAGQEGDIAIAAPDPVMFLRYWNRPEATEEKFRIAPDGTRWLITGDRGWQTNEGRIAYKGRNDDVITSSGYRIGPAEIEDCLLTHPSVAMAGVVGVPDSLRGEAIAAFVTLSKGHTAGPGLADEITAYVRARLAAHEAPRHVVFLDDMPLTTTGKIIRRKLREIGLSPE